MQTDVPYARQHTSYFSQAAKIAVSYFKQTVQASGSRCPQSAIALHNVALLYRAMGKGKQSRALFQKALTIFEETYGTGIPIFYSALNFLGGNCHIMPDADIFQKDEHKATLITVDILPTDFVVSPEIIQHVPDQHRQFKQALITWGNSFSPEFPSLVSNNILSMVFREESLEKFSALIGKKFVMDHREFTLFGLVGILQEWKWNSKQYHLNGFSQKTEKKEEFNTMKDVRELGVKLNASQEHASLNSFTVTEETYVEIASGQNGRMDKTDIEFPFKTENALKQDVRKSKHKASIKAPEKTNAVEQLADLVTSKLQSKTLEDLNQLISGKNRKKFIKKLFGKNESKYEEFVSYIEKISTWRNASAAIEDYFHQAGIYHYDRDALEFTDLIYNRYFPVEKDHFSESKF